MQNQTHRPSLVEKALDARILVFQKAFKELNEAQEKSRAYYNAKIPAREIKVGDRVLLKRFHCPADKNNKLLPKFGNFLV